MKRFVIVCTGLGIGSYVWVCFGIQTAFRMLPVSSEEQLTNVGLQVDTGQTKVNPDYQVQHALAVQGTIGVE